MRAPAVGPFCRMNKRLRQEPSFYGTSRSWISLSLSRENVYNIKWRLSACIIRPSITSNQEIFLFVLFLTLLFFCVCVREGNKKEKLALSSFFRPESCYPNLGGSLAREMVIATGLGNSYMNIHNFVEMFTVIEDPEGSLKIDFLKDVFCFNGWD